MTQTEQNLYRIRYRIKYNNDCAAGVDAYKSDGTVVKLLSVAYEDVRFSGGLWRVQNPEPKNIVRVRDMNFVLGERLPVTEKNRFEYYRAQIVGENCYGKFVFSGGAGTMIVAKYETQDGTFWSYGETIEQARAFLGIKLYDTYSDLIHRAVGTQKTK